MAKRSKETALLPVNNAREAALFFVVAALCFLAVLSALTAKATYAAADSWTGQVEGELTIQLKGADRRSADEAIAVITQDTRIVSAAAMPADEAKARLREALNVGELPDAALPIPVMITVSADPAAKDIAPDLTRKLTEAGFDPVVFKHAAWAGDVRRSLGALRLAALFAVVLLAATALAVIAFATHAALLAQKSIVNVLHLSGATDGFVANLFERRFWLLGLRAGAVGALAALGGAALLIVTAGSTGGRQGLMPQLTLDIGDMLIMILTPIVAGFAARMAARLTVRRTLAEAG